MLAGSPMLRTLLQAAVIWTLTLAALPWLITLAEDRLGIARWASQVSWWIGLAALGAASTGGLYSAHVMVRLGDGTPLPLDPTRRLVIRGPYAHVRNPMAIFGLAQGVGVGLLFGSWFVLLYVLCGLLLWNYVVRPWEEQDLLRRFGEPYERYKQAVRCWWPRRSPWRPDDLHARSAA